MSLAPPTPAAPPVASRPARRSDRRFLLVWAILFGGLAVGWATHRLPRGQWFALMMFIYFVPYKIAALISLTGEERRRWTGGRLLAFFIWVGLQPRPFLLGYTPPGTEPRPTWRGFLLNVLTGVVLLWGVPWLFPAGTPLLVRAWTGLVGWAFLRLFAAFDAWALVFRALGLPVEKPWVNPAAATSLRDFWGRRWNRFMSGMMRDMLFTPLARRVSAIGATVVVFVYSGVLHEFVSVLARGGYGGPLLYFLIQCAGFLLEGTRPGRWLVRRPWLGWSWTMLVVVGPVALVVPPALLSDVIVPVLREARVPGLSP
jgi:hypothetical protein